MDPIEAKLSELWLIYTGEPADPSSDSELRQFGMDSLDRLELAMDIEDAFDIAVRDGDEDHFYSMTFKKLSRFVKTMIRRG